MKPDPSNPFAAVQNGSSERAENPFEQAAKESQVRLPLQQEEVVKTTRIQQLPKRGDQSELPASPFSIDTDPAPKAFEPPEIRMSDPMEGFATPNRSANFLKTVREIPQVSKQDPFVMPDPFEQPATKPVAEVAISSQPNPVANSQPVAERQLILRAIFGVAHDLNREEILSRASSLSGIVSVQVLGSAELAAFRVLRDGIQMLGHAVDLKVVSKKGSVELIHEKDVSLVVLYEGEYRPGVREVLTIVARALSRAD